MLALARCLAHLALPLALAALTVACVSNLPASGQAFADENGDPARGLAYVQDHCATCHGVRAEDAVSPIANAPRFQDVANTPGFTHIALNAWLHTSHPNMPDIIVDTARIDDIYAYLRTLRTHT